jgi:hypothetical protein
MGYTWACPACPVAQLCDGTGVAQPCDGTGGAKTSSKVLDKNPTPDLNVQP